MENNRGFTLVELVIVLLIIAIIAGIVVGRFGAGTRSAENAKAQAEMDNIRAAVIAMRMDTGFWPAGTAWDVDGTDFLINSAGLGYVIKDDGSQGSNANLVSAQGKAKTPYLEVPPAVTYLQDPWEKGYYVYYYSGNKTLWVLSRGPDKVANAWDWTDGKPDTGDDLMTLIHRF